VGDENDTMVPDVGFLSGQNWALKSFAAILWSTTTEPERVRYRLAADSDVRVRRALAVHLVQNQAAEDKGTLVVSPSGESATFERRTARATLLGFLREDPCFSARVAARATTPTTSKEKA
jgi:hypothetical protein